jgi:glycosyltransferase involved in cell wall biosynthesis
MYKGRLITVMVPCVHTPSNIDRVLSSIPSFVDEVIVIVDAISRDHTAGLAGADRTKVIAEDIHGSGSAYINGIMQAKGEIIVSLDPDHMFPVDSISYLLEVLLRSDVRFVSASRFLLGNKNAMSFKFRLGNRILSLILSLLYLRWVSDSQSGVWVFERSILDEINLIGDMLVLCEELKIEAIRNPKIGFMEIFLEFSNLSGEKKLRPYSDGMHNLLFMIRKRFTRRLPPRKFMGM